MPGTRRRRVGQGSGGFGVRLGAEIEEDRKAASSRRAGKKPGRGVPGIGARPRRPTPRPDQPGVGLIKGVGDAYRRKLEAGGHPHGSRRSQAADVAKMRPDALAISTARAKAIVAAAKKVRK